MTTDTPASKRWAEEARTARRRLYPLSIVYTALASAALVAAVRSGPTRAASAWALGVAFWTWVEYMVHRHILHGVFSDGPGLRRVRHRLFGHLHVEHHARPWDGRHINGVIRNSAPFLAPAALVALLFPPHTLLAFLAGFVQAYVCEEWLHHSVHFYHCDNAYFRYIKRHHLYHHSPLGEGLAYGLTSAVWDAAYGTRVPARHRAVLHGRKRRATASPTERAGARIAGLPIDQE